MWKFWRERVLGCDDLAASDRRAARGSGRVNVGVGHGPAGHDYVERPVVRDRSPTGHEGREDVRSFHASILPVSAAEPLCRAARESRSSRRRLRLECAHHLDGVVEMQVLMAAGAAADAIEEPTAEASTRDAAADGRLGAVLRRRRRPG